jgi:hypothetical protein
VYRIRKLKEGQRPNKNGCRAVNNNSNPIGRKGTKEVLPVIDSNIYSVIHQNAMI